MSLCSPLSLPFWLFLSILPATARQQDAPGEPDKEEESPLASALAGLEFRSIGPAYCSGRIVDFAVDPQNSAHYYAAAASGGVWKTVNSGTTWTPVFDGEASYSIGCVTMDPHNSNVVWVGTGENNSQRSVSFGDGVYRSVDGGEHWENMGLGASEHIGAILIDPRDSDVVYVAAQGPLWNDGGDRGLYKTTDGGKSWEKVLEISERTGVNEVVFDPRDPDVLYASAYQRRRRVWTLLNGGPESAIYKSEDAGKSWRKLTHGIPEVDLGRIGLAVSPANPDIVYAIIEAAEDKGGFFRSTNRGETWSKRCDYMTTSPQYYNEIFCDPEDPDRVYALDTFLQVTENGGASFAPVPGKDRHVDDHALWIDPQDTRHMRVGCDGGIYETWERGENWNFKANLPITQFYRVSVDNSLPFYYVYGGTQDNNSMGGPSRTTSPAGIANEDWFVTVGGDGYETVVDPEDPNVVYSQWQYGGLVRYDRQSRETIDIKPRELPGEEPYRWNWDSPLMISPHLSTRLYFAANRLFRSDDRGDSWRAISGDLTRQIDRNTLPVMGRVWNVDAVAKNASTSFYGNCVALTESPLVEGLLYVGTDDGLIQVTSDGGESWTELASFPGVPDGTYVSCLQASLHDEDTVYATFDNHKNGDFAPYVLMSPDRGRSWISLTGDLPERHIVYAIAQDHVSSQLLFVGTEFGVFCTLDRGRQWHELNGGLPTIAVRDVEIQRRENDLVLGTFGRSFYVLDDYSPLRTLSDALLEREATLFPVEDAWSYVETSRLGGREGRGSQGAAFFTAPNPPFGAVFTYYLKDKLETRRERRRTAEKEALEAEETAPYPTFDQLRVEDAEVEPQILLTVRAGDEVVRRVSGSREKGLHRTAWDLRYPASSPVELAAAEDLAPWESPSQGPLVAPGTYTVTLERLVDGELTALSGPRSFDVVPLELATLPAADREAALEFRLEVSRLRRAVSGALEVAREAETRMKHCRKAVLETPAADPRLVSDVRHASERMDELLVALRGDRSVSSRNEPTPPSISERVENIIGSQWYTTSAPTQTERDAYRFAGEEFAAVLAGLRETIDVDLRAIEARLEASGAPWTPGRLPDWKME